MTDEEKYTAARLKDLSQRAYGRSVWTFSEFLSLSEQDLVRTCASCQYELVGGYDAAERRIAVFGSEELCGYKSEPPISVVSIEPAARKFADKLTHRDYLGALMSLGLKRSTLGDIVIKEDAAYLVCLQSVVDFICDNLIQIKHTTVRCSPAERVPQPDEKDLEPVSLVTASERLDGLVSAVYKLSRSESKLLIEQGKVFVDSRMCLSSSSQLDESSIVSVRGKGRFKYLGVDRQTKKGKLSVSVIVYR